MAFSLGVSMNRGRKTSHVRRKSELEEKRENLGNDLASNKIIDLLKIMKNGTKLLKLCNHVGKSHWRSFNLNKQNNAITWKSDNKDINKTTIYIKDIIQILYNNKNTNNNINKWERTLPNGLNKNELLSKQFTIKYIENRVLNMNNNITSTTSTSIIDDDEDMLQSGEHTPSAHVNELKAKGGHFTLRGFQGGNTQHGTLHENGSMEELHLMAETTKKALIWVTGLRNLVKWCNEGHKLNDKKGMNMMVKNLYKNNEFINRQILTNVTSINGNKNLTTKKLKKFKKHLMKTNQALHQLVLPKLTKQEKIFAEISPKPDDEENIYLSSNINNKTNNIIIRKTRKNMDFLNNKLHEISEANIDNMTESRLKQFRDTLKRDEYELKRIDIDIMGLQIALNNRNNIKNKKSKKISNAHNNNTNNITHNTKNNNNNDITNISDAITYDKSPKKYNYKAPNSPKHVTIFSKSQMGGFEGSFQ